MGGYGGCGRAGDLTGRGAGGSGRARVHQGTWRNSCPGQLVASSGDALTL